MQPIEPLERRLLMAYAQIMHYRMRGAYSVNLFAPSTPAVGTMNIVTKTPDLAADGTLRINGTAGSDELRIDLHLGVMTVYHCVMNSPDVQYIGSVPYSDVKQIIVTANRGDDAIDFQWLWDDANANAPVPIRIYGGAGNDTIIGSIFADRIFAGEGDDNVDGGDGRDTIYAELGDDHVRGLGGSDFADGGDGADTIAGDAGNDRLIGGANSDRLRGNDGSDTLDGGGSRDYLAGEAGDDFLIGGTGDDYLGGGLGADELDGGRDLDTIEENPDEATSFANVEFASRIDVTNNKLIVQQPLGTWDGTSYTSVVGLIQTGRGDGGWNSGSGIITTMTDAAVTSLTSLGVATAADVCGIGQGDTTVFAGQTITGDSILVMYTWPGDADLDGDLDDYFIIDPPPGG